MAQADMPRADLLTHLNRLAYQLLTQWDMPLKVGGAPSKGVHRDCPLSGGGGLLGKDGVYLCLFGSLSELDAFCINKAPNNCHYTE